MKNSNWTQTFTTVLCWGHTLQKALLVSWMLRAAGCLCQPPAPPAPPPSWHTHTRTKQHAAHFFTWFHGSGSQPFISDIWAPHKPTEWQPPPVFNCFAPPCVASKKTTQRQMDVHSHFHCHCMQRVALCSAEEGKSVARVEIIERCRVSVAAARRECAK